MIRALIRRNCSVSSLSIPASADSRPRCWHPGRHRRGNSQYLREARLCRTSRSRLPSQAGHVKTGLADIEENLRKSYLLSRTSAPRNQWSMSMYVHAATLSILPKELVMATGQIQTFFYGLFQHSIVSFVPTLLRSSTSMLAGIFD